MTTPLAPDNRVSLQACMRRLWLIWGSGVVFFLAVFFIQSALDKYGPRTSTAGMWFATLLLPPITLLAGQWGYTRKQHSQTDSVDGGVLGVNVVLSVVHLSFMVLVLLLQPSSGQSPIQFLERMQPVLLITGSLLTAFMGALFVSQRPDTTITGAVP